MVYNPSKETYILSSVNLIHGKTSHLRNVIMIKLHVYRIVQTVLRLIDYILSLEFCNKSFHPSFCVIEKKIYISIPVGL